MKNNSLVGLIYLTFFISIAYSQNQAIMSYEGKYANGSGSSIDYFENILDVNYYFDNGLYLFSQLEYSAPPLLGVETEDVNDIINILFLQYNAEKYDITFGDLYLLYGKGLSLHTFQDQAIDFNNSLKGINTNYYLSEKINLSGTIGISNVKTRINPADILPSLSIKNNLGVFGLSYFTDKMNVIYNNVVYEQFYDYSDINSLMDLTNLLGQYLNDRGEYILLEQPSFDMLNIEHNFGFDFYFNQVQLYVEKSLVYYDKLLAERDQGYKDYLSLYANFFDFNLLFEYKDYNTPYLYNIFSAPPMGFREPISILSSRNLHTVDFSNEFGYMLELSRMFNNSLNMVLSYSYALHHLENQRDPSVFKYVTTAKMQDLEEYWPYKQYYIEFSNVTKNEKLFYKIGYDYYHEINPEKTIIAETIPMHFSYSLTKGNSVTFYFEAQNKNEVDFNKKNDYFYFNPSYNHFGKWSFALFYDYEDGEDLVSGCSYTINLKESQFSIYLGSQKGGLVCANGSCIMQPDFNEGVKLNYLTSF